MIVFTVVVVVIQPTNRVLHHSHGTEAHVGLM